MAKSELSVNRSAVQNALTHSALQMVAGIAQEKGQPAYVIGGFVRDLLLGRNCKDIDIVTLGSGIELAETIASKLKVNVSVFKNYGTAMLKHDDWELEFVGARKESYQRDSRKPIVEEGTLKDDQDRRDFTINALAVSLNKEDFGALIDPFGGISDLQNGIIRTPLDANITYSDDPLRMMRAIRFATQLGFIIEKKSLDAITGNKERIKIISKERITEELNKIILSPVPSVGFKLLFDTGLLELIFPEMHALHGIEERNGQSHKDNFYHTIQVLDQLCPKSNDLWLRWAAILHDIAKPPTKRFAEETGWTFHGHEDLGSRMVPGIFKRMKLPLDHKMKFVQKMVLLHLRPIALTNGNITDSAVRRLIFEAGEDIDSLMNLCESDITTKNRAKLERFLKNFANVRQVIKEVEERDRLRNWQPPITGELIMETFGIGQCKEVGVIKNAIRESILEGEIKNNFDEAFQLMINLGQQLGLKKAI